MPHLSSSETVSIYTRRDMLKLQAMVGLGLSGLAFTNAFAQVRTDPVNGMRSHAKPQRGGILARSQSGPPPNFDPMSNTTSRVLSVVGPCVNGLVRFGEFAPDTVEPDLAESWSISPDGTVYTFHLRKGLKFHDAKPCTAADVKFTFDILRAPPAGYVSVRSNLLSAVQRIEAPDSHTVRFVLGSPSPAFLAILAGGWMVVQPKHILEKGPMKEQLIGTGPFMLKDYKRGTSVELTRNPHYHIPGKPHLDAIRIFFIPEANTELSYFRTGQLDVLGTSSPAMARQWATVMAKTDRLLAGVTQSGLAMQLNSAHKPWDDVRVRQAACLAINREDALKTLMNGEGSVAGRALPGRWALPKAELAKIPGYAPYSEANIVLAKKLLAEAGHPNGFKDTMLVRRIDLFTPFGIFLKDQLAKVNIDVTLDLQETATYNQTRSARRYRMDAGALFYMINDPDAMYGDTATCKGAMNFAQVCDPRIDELFDKQTHEMDPSKRQALAQQLESLTLSSYGTYPVLFRNQYRLVKGNVHNWTQHANEDNCMRMEDCWKSPA